jgi:phosphonate transport system ATP-binding protein
LTPALLRELYGADADDILALGDHISSLQDAKPMTPNLVWPAQSNARETLAFAA